MLGQPSIKIHPNLNPNPHLYFISPKQKIGFGGPNKFPLLKLSKPSPIKTFQTEQQKEKGPDPHYYS